MTEEDLDTMARTIYGEARSETLQGKTAVGWVIRNRVAAHSWYGHTIMAVCLKPLQFSCWNANDPNEPIVRGATLASPVFQQCFGIAALIGSGDLSDPTSGATHYHTTAIHPKWADLMKMDRTIQIGSHVFYKEK